MNTKLSVLGVCEHLEVKRQRPCQVHWPTAIRVWVLLHQVRTQAEQHLGLLGPVIRAEVGDTVR